MSTRKGNIILLEKVLDQAVEEALKVVKEKNATKEESQRLSEDEMKEIAKAVGPGAVIFFDLAAKRTKDVIFDWKRVINFEGDSGPYLQYTHVRLGALLNRAKNQEITWSSDELISIATEEERGLVRELLGFPAVVEAAAKAYEPSLISNALLDLAGSFNRFYTKVPVIKGDEKLRASRLHLVELTRNVLGSGLALLGIDCPRRM